MFSYRHWGFKVKHSGYIAVLFSRFCLRNERSRRRKTAPPGVKKLLLSVSVSNRAVRRHDVLTASPCSGTDAALGAQAASGSVTARRPARRGRTTAHEQPRSGDNPSRRQNKSLFLVILQFPVRVETRGGETAISLMLQAIDNASAKMYFGQLIPISSILFQYLSFTKL